MATGALGRPTVQGNPRHVHGGARPNPLSDADVVTEHLRRFLLHVSGPGAAGLHESPSGHQLRISTLKLNDF